MTVPTEIEDYSDYSEEEEGLFDERQKASDIEKYQEQIYYSDRYSDDQFEYRHVTLPKALAKYVPTSRLMSEAEWRGLGVVQSLGWEHYLIHAPEPHILLFKREKDYQLKYPNGRR
ncbi:CKS-domain-containing protein [Basidiobolus meristosporus CBS 931.73]|uniref:Cyclin-dependent kinases regulatory subunit n=1 Tax=Basidiobolus meristosporus CBS 931.73 TaxID=1314790 RepID=A0A1Y1Z4A6_9FUNG|nr:CKS-domain-containing protein [Basidiobolus meristosporus CBS 931.73]|eukprot:ORY05090.1 CKS-domain-containing protein [Basidiobolus meristosporus CBS 931.73]